MMSTLEPCPWPVRSLDLIPPQPLLWGSPEVLIETNPRSLQDRQEAMKSLVRLVSPSVCRAPGKVVLRRASYSSSEKWVITNMRPARLSQVTLCGGSPPKQNIFEQAFIWYPIPHSSPNTPRNIQLLNSSDFSETPGKSIFCGYL